MTYGVVNKNKPVHHHLVAKTIVQLAGAWYEEAAHDNDFYKFYPNQKLFIEREGDRFTPIAIECLVKQLNTGPADNECYEAYETRQNEIMEALMLERTLPKQQLKPIRAQRLLH